MKRKLQENNLVVESNGLIEAHYRLGAQEQKLLLSVISMIKPSDLEFEEYLVPIKEFKEILKVKGGGSIGRLNKTAKSLMEKSLQIKRDGGGWLLSNWFSSIEEYPSQGQLGFCIDPKLKPYLLSLKQQFTSYQLSHAVQLRSAYSIRIYQLLKQFQNTHAKTREFEFIELRKILGLEKKLARFNDFKKRVLDISKKEISESTDIRFSYSTKKIGRRVNWIIFFIYPKEDNSKKIPDELFELLPGDKERDEALEICNKIFEEKGKECLKWLLEYVNSKKYDNYGAYLRFSYEQGLYEHYLKQKRIEEEVWRKEAEVAEAKRQEQVKKEQAEKEVVDRERYLNKLIEKLSVEEEEELNRRALELLKNDAKNDGGAEYRLKRCLKYYGSKKHKDKAINSLYHYRLKLIEDFRKEEAELKV